MNRRDFLVSAAAAATALSAGLVPAAATSGMSPESLLVRDWRHLKTIDRATGADVSADLSRLSGWVRYGSDGAYVFAVADETCLRDQGRWSLSADGRRLTIESAAFEYGTVLTIEQLDARSLRLVSTVPGRNGEADRQLVEIFAAA